MHNRLASLSRNADLTGRTPSLQTALRILIALALAMISLPFLSTSASAVLVGGFEIDGNRPVDTATGIDWDWFVPSAPRYAHAFDPAPADGFADDDVFQSSKEEGQAPSTWSLRDAKPDQGGDIAEMYSYHAIDGTTGEVWFYLGFARAENGTGAFVVELNQKVNGITTDMPDRTVGDIRITFTQDGGKPNLTDVGASKWTGTGWVAAPNFSSNYTAATAADGLFGEMAVNLSASNLLPDCGDGFTAVNMRSRSSSQETASLKDYVKPLGVTITDARCSDFTINKQGIRAAGPPITVTGARFTITPDPTTAAGASLTVTDGGTNDPDGLANGVISFRTSRFSTYSVAEVAPPSTGDAYGWVLDPITRTALVSLAQDGEVTFTNTLGSVGFTKIDQTNRSLVGGASFQFVKTSGADQNTTFRVTDNVGRDLDSDGGEFLVADLKVGDWTVTELDTSGYPAPPGYTLPSAAPVRGFAVTQAAPNATIATAFENPRKTATLTVEKRDSTTGALVTGPGSAVFRLYTDAGTIGAYDVLDQVVTGGDKTSDDGTATWTGLPWGKYLVQEVSPPTGYQAGAAAYQAVDLGLDDVDEANEVTTVTFENLQRTAQIQVEKFSFANPRVPLSGATFELWKDNGDGVWTSADARITPIGNVETANQPGPDGNNTYTWPDQLAWGDYLVKEITPPAGYTKDPVAVNDAKLVQIRRADADSVVTVEFNDPVIVPVPTTRTITVTKTDADTGFEVGGATFELYFDDGDGVAESGELRDNNPPVTGPGIGTYTWTDLPDGAYLVKEVAPPTGYLPPTAVTQTVPDSGNVGFANEQIKSTIVLTKTDAGTGQQVDTGRFELWKDGTLVSNNSPSHTAGTGVYTWTGLLMGGYVVKEAAPPNGYLPPVDDTENVPTISRANAGGTFAVGFQNEKIVRGGGGDPVDTDIVVTKRDATNNQPIDTATFQLWEDADANGTLQATDDKISPAKNTANGVVSWVNLLKGTYFVEETVAPKGYDLPANTVMTIVVDTNNEGGTLSRSFNDPQKRTTIELVKQDNDTNQVLEGAVFQAYVDVNEDGKYDAGDTAIGGTKTSDADGLVSWSGLKFGHYVIREVKAPTDYDLAADQSVVLDRDNAGGKIQLTFLDVSQGAVAISKVAFEKNASGDWVPSDGEVDFGDLVKYELTADAYGAKMYRDVWVVDYIPGFDPADTKSTTKASYVNGSATCGRPATCPVTFEADEQELAWSLGDMQGEDRTLEFVVRMPLMPVAPVYNADGELIETVVNIAELSWQDDAAQSTQRLAASYGNRSIRSNEVVTTIVDRPEVLDTPPAFRPETVKRPGALLPDTGAPTHSALFGTVGSLSLLLGAWLMLVGRGRGHLPQR